MSPELTTEQKTSIKNMTREWRQNIPRISNNRIYAESRKRFYRIKLYFISKSELNKAKKIAKLYKLGEISIRETTNFWGRSINPNKPTWFDLIIKIPYEII